MIKPIFAIVSMITFTIIAIFILQKERYTPENKVQKQSFNINENHSHIAIRNIKLDSHIEFCLPDQKILRTIEIENQSTIDRSLFQYGITRISIAHFNFRDTLLNVGTAILHSSLHVIIQSYRLNFVWCCKIFLWCYEIRREVCNEDS